jgi:hypothetical protein
MNSYDHIHKLTAALLRHWAPFQHHYPRRYHVLGAAFMSQPIPTSFCECRSFMIRVSGKMRMRKLVQSSSFRSGWVRQVYPLDTVLLLDPSL